MSGTEAQRTPLVIFDHDFAIGLDRHVNESSENVLELRRLFAADQANTKDILEYFAGQGIIDPGLYRAIREVWVHEADEGGAYGRLVSAAQEGFRQAFELCGGPAGPQMETRFMMGGSEFAVVPNRVGSRVRVLIHIPDLSDDTVGYKGATLSDPGFLDHVKTAEEYLQSHLRRWQRPA